jgi:hypothetical protein
MWVIAELIVYHPTITHNPSPSLVGKQGIQSGIVGGTRNIFLEQ